MIALGAVAGVLSGLLGIGGGLVVSPALALRGVPLPRATGTALAVVLPVACVAVMTELMLRPEQLDLGIAAAIALGGQVGAPVTAGLLRRIPTALLRALFVALLVFTAVRALGLWGEIPDGAREGVFSSASGRHLLAAGLGVLAGVCAVLFGVGGGLVVVPGAVFLLGGFAVSEAMATSLLAMVPTAAVGLRLAYRQGRVDLAVARSLMISACAGSVLGVVLRNHALSPTLLSQAFGAFLLFAAWRLARPSSAHRDPRSARRS